MCKALLIIVLILFVHIDLREGDLCSNILIYLFFYLYGFLSHKKSHYDSKTGKESFQKVLEITKL